MPKKCKECGQEFELLPELESHYAGHTILTVSKSPLTLMLQLPDGCTPGRWEAVENFAESFAELKNKYPNTKFQIIPFSYTDHGNSLESILAINLE